jgi:adenine-specific DNA-methyltransferase
MATGISTNEKLSIDSLIAARPHLENHQLPGPEIDVLLRYEGKLSEAKILEGIDSNFAEMLVDGTVKEGQDTLCPNAFVLADNLMALHKLAESKTKATLIYLDPPYGTGMEFQSRHLVEHAYKDNMCPASYVEFMRRRIILLREVLAEEGSIYVHIGHQMLAHLKLILDEVFGARNFKNLIVRRKCSSKNYTQNQYPNLNDYILFYTKTSKYIWNPPGIEPTEEWIEKEYPKTDAKGRYKLVPIHAPGTRHGSTGLPWREKMPPPGKHWQYTPTKLDAFDLAGEIHWSKTGNPRRKVYLSKGKQVSLTDYWEGYRDAHHQSIPVTGYPTEKNLAMLKVIVSASSNAGDLVIDPFCGSGTTLHAAESLDRKWIGIDQSFSAAKATLKRLRHGLQPMGDYVNIAKGQSQGDLFSSTNGANFSFQVDGWLLEDFPNAILDLAKI